MLGERGHNKLPSPVATLVTERVTAYRDPWHTLFLSKFKSSGIMKLDKARIGTMTC